MLGSLLAGGGDSLGGLHCYDWCFGIGTTAFNYCSNYTGLTSRCLCKQQLNYDKVNTICNIYNTSLDNTFDY